MTLKKETEDALKKTFYVLNVINIYQKQVQELKRIKDDLEKKISEAEKFSKLSVDREMKIIELEEKIKKLEKNCSRAE